MIAGYLLASTIVCMEDANRSGHTLQLIALKLKVVSQPNLVSVFQKVQILLWQGCGLWFCCSGGVVQWNQGAGEVDCADEVSFLQFL